jgi:hypothetical protein
MTYGGICKPAPLLMAALFAGFGCLFGLVCLASQEGDLVALCEYGRVIFIIPIALAGVEFGLVLALINRGNAERAAPGHAVPRWRASILLLACLVVPLIPLVIAALFNSHLLESVDVPIEGLSNSQVLAIQQLERRAVEQLADQPWPFATSWHGGGNGLRIVFRKHAGRAQIVRDTVRDALSGSPRVAPVHSDSEESLRK